VKLLTKVGDSVLLIFDPKQEPLEVGCAVEILAPDENRGVLAQVVDIGPLDLPGILTHVVRSVALESPAEVHAEAELGELQARIINMCYAKCKIRKEIVVENGAKKLEDWSGYSPPRDSKLSKVDEGRLLEEIVGRPSHPVVVGEDDSGKKACISAYHLQGLNIIAGKKGTGKSHVAKTVLLGLIDNKAQAVVFDINDEYSGLGFEEGGGESKYHGKVICLTPGENLRFELEYVGLDVFVSALEALKLPDASILEIMNIWKKLEGSAEKLTLEAIEEAVEKIGQSHVKLAIKRRLRSIKETGIITEDPVEAVYLEELFGEELKDGGALVINLKGQPTVSMIIVVQTVLSKLRELLNLGKLQRGRIFIFAEEAHFYLSKADWLDVVTLMRHLGLWQFYITNTPSMIPELIIRQADNLFLFHLDLEDDIARVAQTRGMDLETAKLTARSLPPRTFVLVGTATKDYPVRLRTTALGVKTAGETKQFFEKP